MKQRQRLKMQFDGGYTRMSTKSSDDSGDETELFIRKPPYQEVPTVEKVVEEGDTLQALSIRYHCPISELKRLNNIHRENEVFAKRAIKVPLRCFSVAVASVHGSGTSSPSEIGNPMKDIDVEILKTKLDNTLIDTPSTSNFNSAKGDTIEVNEVIFNTSLKPLTRNCENLFENPIIETINEQVSLLPRSSPPVAETVVSRLVFSGSGADISWIALIICIVIVIFAVPLIYVFYIAEHLEQYHHTHYS